MKSKHLLPCLLLLFFNFRSHSQSIVSLQDDHKLQSIGKSTYFFKDGQHLGIEQILKATTQSKFQAYDQESPNFASIAEAVWFRFELAQKTDGDFYLQVGSAFIDSIALYAVSEGKVTEVKFSGDNYAFKQRTVHVTTFLFPLEIPIGSKQTYFLRTKTVQPFFFPLRVGTLKAFMEDTHKLDFIQGIYFGFMMLILLYNLFLFFSTREQIYLIYVTYVFSITWFMSTVFQYIFEFAWPSVPAINQYAVASSAFTILTATVFTRTFLQTKHLMPRLHWISTVFIGVGLLDLLLVFSPYKIQALILAQMGILLMAIYFLIISILAVRRGNQSAKFYLFAWGFLIFGFIAAILESANVLPVMYYINSMQIGSAIEVMLLSFALADRINMYKRQREEAQAEALKAAQERAELIQRQNILLEEKVVERTLKLSETLQLVEQEREKSDHLLLNILPAATALELKETGKATPKSYDNVSVLFADFQGFSTIAENLDAEELVGDLDEIFKRFDEIIRRHGLEKIKTIGDAYMAAGGLSEQGSDAHPKAAVQAALEIQEFLEKHRTKNGKNWVARCGIHTGPVTAGVVGQDKFAYDIWGSTVNLAARMENASEPGKVNISEATYQKVNSFFECTFRGKVKAKNIGEVNMYFVGV